ncbi:MAG: ComF family protein [Candidatus Aminicenantes bacterium]
MVFFPSFCKLCGRFLENPEEKIVCRKCLGEMKPSRRAYCLCCGRIFGREGEPSLCRDCLEEAPSFSCHRSCGPYSGKLRDVILLFKYRKYRVLGRPLAEFIQLNLCGRRELWGGIDLVVPVPLHKKRQRERGFNQSLVLARHLASWLNYPLASKILSRPVFRPPQTALRAGERRRSVRGVFSVKNPAKLTRKTVLLVDDVCTTGATLEECSRVLLQSGAREVRAVTLARTE